MTLRSPFNGVNVAHLCGHESHLCLRQAYALFGVTASSETYGPVQMDNANFVKLCRECELVGPGFTSGDADIVFTKVKAPGTRKIGFSEFESAVGLIGRHDYLGNPASA